jgi:hypothetical protein
MNFLTSLTPIPEKIFGVSKGEAEEGWFSVIPSNTAFVKI